ncbi:hypothetical protein K431DRAFT_45090 [Polychaeton citri CBS 116435]|uniref:Secreted protein n=1 Tax=Polychaeton citri CBS 116435 TaxID=1314669 RepID=A0A9P4Q8F4_9PEZI|nr:hypothetical protein K431DRAFT_45090 [Polychaeton citri CBS 116435]
MTWYSCALALCNLFIGGNLIYDPTGPMQSPVPKANLRCVGCVSWLFRWKHHARSLISPPCCVSIRQEKSSSCCRLPWCQLAHGLSRRRSPSSWPQTILYVGLECLQ